MNKKTLLVLTTLIMVVVSVLALTGCTTFDNFKEAFFSDQSVSSDTIKIGVLEPQTGNDSNNGQLEINGIEIANQMASDVLGKKIELIYADTQSSIYTTETAVQDLIGKNVTAILGPYGDATSLVAGQYIEKAHIPAVTITSSNPLITLNNKYYFRTSFSEASQGYAIADYVAKHLNIKTAVAIRIENDETSSAMIAKFENELKEVTGDENALATIIEVKLDETNYTEYIDDIKKSQCKAVFLPVDLTTADKLFAEATKANLSAVTFVLPKDAHNDELIALQLKYPNIKIAVASDFNNNMSGENEYYDKFMAAYQKKYGNDKEPTDAEVLGFDAYMIAVQAIERAGSTDGEFVRKALLQTSDYEGASGEITFNGNGDPKKMINIDVIKDSVYVSDYTVK